MDHLPKTSSESWRSLLKDILVEFQNHKTAEEVSYTLFRCKKAYDESNSDTDKQKIKELFYLQKPKVEEILKIDIREAEEVGDEKRVTELNKLLTDVENWNL